MADTCHLTFHLGYCNAQFPYCNADKCVRVYPRLR
jgi:hypothetical protein